MSYREPDYKALYEAEVAKGTTRDRVRRLARGLALSIFPCTFAWALLSGISVFAATVGVLAIAVVMVME